LSNSDLYMLPRIDWLACSLRSGTRGTCILTGTYPAELEPLWNNHPALRTHHHLTTRRYRSRPILQDTANLPVTFPQAYNISATWCFLRNERFHSTLAWRRNTSLRPQPSTRPQRSRPGRRIQHIRRPLRNRLSRWQDPCLQPPQGWHMAPLRYLDRAWRRDSRGNAAPFTLVS
jgi:hypothetical protein